MSDDKNLQITYFLGAGASFNAIPIWKEQALSMAQLARDVQSYIKNNQYSKENSYLRDDEIEIYMSDKLKEFFKELEFFGNKAVEYGSIDIYARRLSLLGKKEELNLLKKCVSVYFDLWESNFYGLRRFIDKPKMNEKDDKKYDRIDKRYYSLFSVILGEGKQFPVLNKNVNFITWNYDLQVEKAYESFLENETKDLKELINKFNNQSKNIIHLNGFRGLFNFNEDSFETVEKEHCTSLSEYLNKLADNEQKFKNNLQDYSSSIKYAWEGNEEDLSLAKERMRNTDILIVIGYSFPAFNREIDQELIDTFKNNGRNGRVVIQNPKINKDLLEIMFKNIKVEEVENTEQFYIAPEFLTPSIFPSEYF